MSALAGILKAAYVEASAMPPSPASRYQQELLMARMSQSPWLLVVVLFGALAMLGWIATQ